METAKLTAASRAEGENESLKVVGAVKPLYSAAEPSEPKANCGFQLDLSAGSQRPQQYLLGYLFKVSTLALLFFAFYKIFSVVLFYSFCSD